jgi:hypothetical protein
MGRNHSIFNTILVLRTGSSMLKRIPLLALISSALLATVACTVIDDSLSPRVSTLNSAIDRATNDAILTNIVRASRLEPLTFVAISKVGGSQQAALTTGLPSFHFGPDLTSTQKQFSFANNSLNQNAAGSFDVAPLAGRDFTKGLMLPLSMQEIELLIRQGLPRELLFNLIFESIDFIDCDLKTVPTTRIDNEFCPAEDYKPTARTCTGKFVSITGKGASRDVTIVDIVDEQHKQRNKVKSNPTLPAILKGLAYYGLNVESRPEVDPFVNRETRDSRESAGGSAKGKVELLPTVVNSRFCFDQGNRADFKHSPEWYCGTEWYFDTKSVSKTAIDPNRQSALFYDQVIDYCPPGKLDAIQIKNVRLNIRSIYAIFRFLGTQLVSGDPSPLKVPIVNGGKKTYPLLHVEQGRSRSCFASIQLGAENYCVPEDGSPATKMVFSVLAQLIALKTQPGDLPFTPTVRIAP